MHLHSCSCPLSQHRPFSIIIFFFSLSLTRLQSQSPSLSHYWVSHLAGALPFNPNSSGTGQTDKTASPITHLPINKHLLIPMLCPSSHPLVPAAVTTNIYGLLWKLEEGKIWAQTNCAKNLLQNLVWR